MNFKSLYVRLMAAFALVILIAVAIIFIVVNQTTTNEFRTYMFRGQMTQSDQLARELAAYYSARGSWQGVDRYLAQTFDVSASGMMGGGLRGRGIAAMMSAPIVIADANGMIVASRDGTGVGQKLTSAQMTDGTPIQVGEETVGLFVTQAQGTSFDAQQQEFLQRTNLSLLMAGGVAGAIALILGLALFYQITAPLNALNAAARKIAGGDLTARVPNPHDDEIGQVGRAFNAMADSLAQSETARQNMIADVAHELRNPLGVIQGQLEGMLDGVFPLADEQIASLHDETLLLARLVDDLRELALADAGQLRVARQFADLHALIERTVDAFAPQAVEKNISLKAEIADALPQVNIDPQRIEQVLRNLVSNALRFTPSNGTVKISVDQRTTALIVRVRDTGPGIPAEELPHVFERFWRGDKSRSRAGGGAGLGLAIAQQLIAAHGGTIGVESELGSGATFWFKLPV